MNGQLWAVLALLAGWAAIVMWRRNQDDRIRNTPPLPDDEIDRDELEQAEQEAKDMQQDVRGRPLEDAVGDDWGPGTPKPPYV